jgi:chromosome segregation ATPase
MKKKDDGKLAEDVRMAETLDTLGAKIEELSASVDKRFEQVDKRFEQVDKRLEDGFTAVAEQFTEQRAYTEFAYGRLEKEMTGRFDRLERKLDQVLAAPPRPRRRKRP